MSPCVLPACSAVSLWIVFERSSGEARCGSSPVFRPFSGGHIVALFSSRSQLLRVLLHLPPISQESYCKLAGANSGSQAVNKLPTAHEFLRFGSVSHNMHVASI